MLPPSEQGVRARLSLVASDMPRKPKEFNKRDALFTERLNHLFTTRMDPEGKPYSVRGVAEATGISATYVSNMRTGKVGLPGLDKLEALASFFGVPVSYFMGAEA